jgi:nucleoside phosphorylase
VVSAWEPELRRLRVALTERAGVAGRVTARPVGIGLVEAAIGAARAISEVRPGVVIFVGTAGVYPAARGAPAVGAAALAARIQLLSSAAVRGQAYFPPVLPTRVDTDPALRAQLVAATALPEADLACPLGITQTAATAARTAAATRCALENLEAFAVGRAAARADTRFAAVLGVSNVVGPTAHEEWKTHAEAAAAAACDAVIRWLEGRD